MRFSLLILSLLSTLAWSAETLLIKPVIKRVKLETYTTFNVQLVPDLGTRFIFPFVLDETDDLVPFTLDITNPLFISTRHEGRNSFTIEVDPPKEGGAIPTYLGNLFVTAAGYNLSIVLSTTTDLRQHTSDYIFELSAQAREDLIQQAVSKRTQSLEQAYQDKSAQLDQRAAELALRQVGMLALSDPDSDSIKEESVLELATGEQVTLYLSQVMTYGKRFKLFQYEVTNDTADDLRITDAAILAVDQNGITQKLVGANSIIPRIESGKTVKGVITTDSPLINNDQVSIRLSVVTSAGVVEVNW